MYRPLSFLVILLASVHTIGQQRSTPLYSFDFSVSSNWTMDNTSAPDTDWEIVASLTSSLQAQGLDMAINSISGGKFALIDSDDEGPTATQNANLNLDSTLNFSSSNSVILGFLNYHRRLNDVHTVQVSNDGGTNWDDYPVNSNYPQHTTSPNSELVEVNISATAANQSNVLVRFNYQGAFDWFWAIDDVEFYEAPDHDLAIVDHQWSIDGKPYTVIPSGQFTGTNFPDPKLSATIRNKGANAETNASLSGSILDGLFVSQTTNTCTPQPIGIATDIDMSTSLTMPALLTGNYWYHWKLNYDNNAIDDNISNDSVMVPFRVSDNEYALDLQDTGFYNQGIWNGTGEPYIVGNVFRIYTSRDISIIRCAIHEDTDIGAIIYGQIYHLNESTGTLTLQYDGSGTTDGEVGIAPHKLSTDSVVWINIPIDGGSHSLLADESYLICVGTYGGQKSIVLDGGMAADSTTMLFDTLTGQWDYYPRVASIRALFSPETTLGKPEYDIDHSVHIYPNPTTDFTNIEFYLNTKKEVTALVYSLSGQKVISRRIGAVSPGKHRVELSTGPLDPGIYTVQIRLGDDTVNKRLVILNH